MKKQKKDSKIDTLVVILFSIACAITIICIIATIVFKVKLNDIHLDDYTKKIIESDLIGVIFFLALFGMITIILLLLIIQIPRKVKYEDSIENEQIADYNNIILTKNNVYSLFNIKVTIYQGAVDKDKANCVIKVGPQLKNYLYMSSAITILVNQQYEQTILLNSKGKGKCKFKIVAYKNKENYKVIDAKGSMMRNMDKK